MQNFDLSATSEMVTHAGYEPNSRVLYLTYRGGPTTIAYHDVSRDDVNELRKAEYPDTCIRFHIQANHAFRRLDKGHRLVDLSFVK